MTEDIQKLKERIAELENQNKIKIKNIIMEVQNDNILIIEVDLKQDFGKSQSGKTNIIASTGGFIPIPGAEGFSLNLNAVKK